MLAKVVVLALAVCASGATTWDVHTNNRIALLHPSVRTAMAAFVNNVQAQLGIRLRVTSGYRSFAEQTALYAKGRTAPGSIVTNAKAGQSYHNYGVAVDVCEITASGSASFATSMYNKIAPVGKALGLKWGGDWTSFVDRPHFQWTDGKTTSQLLALYNSNGKVYTNIPLSLPAVPSAPPAPVSNYGPCSVSGKAGLCGDRAGCLAKGGSATAGLCPGPSNVQCCVEKSCIAAGKAGTCGEKSVCALKTGTSTAGLCPGPSTIRCCVTAVDYGSCKVGSNHGLCGDYAKCSAQGGTATSGLCPGPSNIRCCVY